MERKQFLNFNSKNKKAFIFTMDVSIAMIITFSLLFTASFFVTKKIQDPFPSLQSLRTGSDIIRVMEYKVLFDNPNGNTISTYLEDNLPSRFGMNIEGSSNAGCFFEAGDTIPTNKDLSGGKEFFSTEGGDYCSMRYSIWLK